MNWKNILVVSVLLNIILIIGLFIKYNLSNHSSFEKIDSLLATSNSLTVRHNDYSIKKIEPTLYRTPSIRKSINKGIVKLRETKHQTEEHIDSLILEIETIKNNTGEIDLESRIKPYHLLKENNGLEKLLPHIESTLDSMEFAFDEIIQVIKKELRNRLPLDYEKGIKKTIPVIDFKSKIKSLKNISLLETRMIFHSIQVDLSNVSSIYINAIEDAISISLDESNQFNRLKVITNPKSPRVKLGEKYEAQLAVVKYLSSSFDGNATIMVNGKEYPLGEDGLLHYRETPKKVGKRTLNLKSRIVNPLSGQVTTGSSTFEYNVLP